MEHHWGYEDNEAAGSASSTIAPAQWPKYYKTGERQSPINILVPANLGQLIKSTCCHGKTFTTTTTTKTTTTPTSSTPILAQRLANQLNLNTNSPASRHKRRTHLDSLGSSLAADSPVHERSSSTSSFGSALSASNSPQNGHSTSGNQRRRPKQTRSSNGKRNDAGDIASSTQVDYDEDQDSGEYDNENDDDYDDNYYYGDYEEQQQNLDNNNKTDELIEGGGKQNTRFCVSNKKIFLGYPRYLSHVQLSNTGHSWQVELPRELAEHTLLSGPPFGGREYRLAQLHCHWAENCTKGSEHQLNGRSYAAELHFVHWNCTDFSSMQEASKHQHGLAVLGVLVDALAGDEHRNRHLDKIAQALGQVREANSRCEVKASRLDLKKLFPANRWVYASYEGSLTTPPLSEVVDWVVFLQPIECSAAQIEQFRQLSCQKINSNSNNNNKPAAGECHANLMVKNCRPVQPHNNRLVTIWTHH